MRKYENSYTYVKRLLLSFVVSSLITYLGMSVIMLTVNCVAWDVDGRMAWFLADLAVTFGIFILNEF